MDVRNYVRHEALPYWEGLKRSELWIQQCKECKKYNFYPRDYCPHDMGELEFVRASGKGKVLTFTIVVKAANPVSPDRSPYVMALIQLDEGPVMLSHVIDVEPSKVEFDQRVEIVYEKVPEDMVLPLFKPES